MTAKIPLLFDNQEFITITENNLWAVTHAVSDELCDFLVNHAENSNKKEDEEWKFKPCNFGGVRNEQYRSSWEIHLKNNDAIKLMWNTVKKNIPKLFQGRKLIGPHYKTFYLLRYKPGEKFDVHRDGHSTNSKGEKSFLTVLLYLNNCEEGGATRFFEEPFNGINFNRNVGSGVIDVIPEKGTLVLMRHYIMHQAMPVIKGVKYALRFNVIYERFGTKGWYEGPSRPELKLPREGEVAYEGHDRPPSIKRCYYFLPQPEDSHFLYGRLPRENEDRCEKCYEILDLDYDYYFCPGCNSPVFCTTRNPFVNIENSTSF